MGAERPKVKDHWMILRCGVKIWNRWRKANPDTRPDLEKANLLNANLERADLQWALLKDADLVEANLLGANFRDARLMSALLWNADLGYAKLKDANLWDAYLPGANLESADLEGANLKGADLEEAYLEGANLKGADLEGANLEDAYLQRVNLEGANLEGSNLEGVNLKGANLERANLQRASLKGTNLKGANLQRANLQRASLWGARFAGTWVHETDLSGVQGLGEAVHQGPSPVSTQTLKKSEGQIPEVFLKGCGLEDWEILSARLHDPNLRPDQIADITYEIHHVRAESPIVPLSVFISYCHEDQRFVDKLEARFDKARIRYWRDVHDLNAGLIEPQVDRAIGFQRATLLVLSADSVDSDWVEHEARKAREVEKERRKSGEGQYVLCPIALDGSWETCDWPERLREQIEKYVILDFSRWGSDEEFGRQFERLKTGLRIHYANEKTG